jgi:hypothetical protein
LSTKRKSFQLSDKSLDGCLKLVPVIEKQILKDSGLFSGQVYFEMLFILSKIKQNQVIGYRD